jgi:hypothetical protein
MIGILIFIYNNSFLTRALAMTPLTELFSIKVPGPLRPLATLIFNKRLKGNECFFFILTFDNQADY